jgi:hypothetical protein
MFFKGGMPIFSLPGRKMRVHFSAPFGSRASMPG